ncbi:hypothetical protein ACFYN3_28460 [Streptomyces lavendulae]|uniref:hypothetical protein n=1 Tax=Streptomyces lavendulae TaxID=1914 RepID=UPI0036980CE0
MSCILKAVSDEVTGLPDIPDNTLDETAYSTPCVTLYAGPLMFMLTAYKSPEMLIAKLFANDTLIALSIVTPENPEITVGGGLATCRAKATYAVDFNARQAKIKSEVCIGSCHVSECALYRLSWDWEYTLPVPKVVLPGGMCS